MYIALYFFYLLYLIKLTSVGVGGQPLFIAALFPLFVFSLYSLMTGKKRWKNFLTVCLPCLIFFFADYYFSNSNINKAVRGLGYCFVIMMHVFICFNWIRKMPPGVTHLRNAFFFLSVFGVFIPHYIIVGSLKFGAFYNLVDDRLLTMTTVDAPLIVSLLFLLSAFDLYINKSRTLVNILAILFSVFVLLLFSRRGFIFSSLIALALYQMCVKLKSRFVIYITLILLFLPVFWDTISVLLVSLFKSSLIESVLERHDTSEIAEATGRIFMWTNSLNAFFSFDSKLIFGFHGGPPTSFFIQDIEGKDRFNHAHNTFLQIFLEAGYFTCGLFIIMLVNCLKRINQLKKQNVKVNNFYLLLLLFFFSLSGTESLVKLVALPSLLLVCIVIGLNYNNILLADKQK